jgi:hypothetical protein
MATNGQGMVNAPGAVGSESINTDIITLTRLLTEEQLKHPEATGDFTYVYVVSYTVHNTDIAQALMSRSSVRIQEHRILHSTCYSYQCMVICYPELLNC